MEISCSDTVGYGTLQALNIRKTGLSHIGFQIGVGIRGWFDGDDLVIMVTEKYSVPPNIRPDIKEETATGVS
jgi:hypothetical protein